MFFILFPAVVFAQAGAGLGNTLQPGTPQPGTPQPGITQPGAVQPGILQPGILQPGIVQPGAAPTWIGNTIAPMDRVQIALSAPDYMVTAGDVYLLTYAVGSQVIEYAIPVDASYRVRVANLGVIDASGKTYNQLRTQVENIVINNYPSSGAKLVLSQPASFLVLLKGEVITSIEVSAWALLRLSDAINGYLTLFSSTRDIQIRSASGQTKTYDLFKAQRMGDISQNPYIRPGDVITVNRLSRSVTIDGAVERIGTYQLLEGENLRELIEKYASGFTPIADKTRMELVRVVNSSEISGNKVFLKENDISLNFALENYDTITVPEISQLQPIMFVEGAVSEGIYGNIATPTASTRLNVNFKKGETYASLVRRNSAWFTSISDTRNAYIIRDENRMPINLNSILFDALYHEELLIEEEDVLIVPFRQYFVTVSGAVAVPGRYPYIPDRDWEYYIALAGGFIKSMNSRESIVIVDIAGNRMQKTDVITPETVITAKTNAILYQFNQYAPVVMTTLSIITTFLSIYLATR